MTGWKHDLTIALDQVMKRLRTRLVGLSDDDYLWEPVPGCWTVRPDEAGTWRGDWESPVWPPPFTSIAWRLGHIIHNLFDARYATLLGLTPMQPPPGSLPATAQGAIDLVERGGATTASYLAAVEESALAEPLGPLAGPWAAEDRASFVLHILDELTHHAAEVAVLRDLYRSTRPPNPLIDVLLAGDADASIELVQSDPQLLDRAKSERADLLIQAAAQENFDALRLLVDLGFALMLPDGTSALHFAARAGHLEAARLLIDDSDTELRDPVYRATPGEWAAFFGHDELAEELS